MPKLLYYIFKTISSPPDKAAKMLCSLAIGKKFENSNGTFLKQGIQSNKYSYDKDLQDKLWSLSEQLVN